MGIPSGGARPVGVENDLGTTLALHKGTTFELGISHLAALRVLPGNLEFDRVSVDFKYRAAG